MLLETHAAISDLCSWIKDLNNRKSETQLRNSFDRKKESCLKTKHTDRSLKTQNEGTDVMESSATRVGIAMIVSSTDVIINRNV